MNTVESESTRGIITGIIKPEDIAVIDEDGEKGLMVLPEEHDFKIGDKVQISTYIEPDESGLPVKRYSITHDLT